MSFKVIIPARYASTRLPGKPLLDIAGKPMLQHVYERACASEANSVIIATDDQRIADTAHLFGAEVCMTRSDHRSGTDRLAEVVEKRPFAADDIIINVQGDEPCLPASLINQLAHDLAAHKDAAIASLYSPISQEKQLFDPNVVKVVIDAAGYALYFSRAAIPWLRDHFNQQVALPAELPHYRHIGLYAYRCEFLKSYSGLIPSPLEQAESLEQLRALHNGYRIHMTQATVEPGHGVDNEQDLFEVRQILQQ